MSVTPLVVTFTAEETEQINSIAKANGFDDAARFIRALVDEVSDYHPVYDNPLVSLERALQDYKAGRVYPVSALWEALNRE
jgi:hypothetical protein